MTRVSERALARDREELELLRRLGLTRLEHEEHGEMVEGGPMVSNAVVLVDECICPPGHWRALCPVHGIGPPRPRV